MENKCFYNKLKVANPTYPAKDMDRHQMNHAQHIKILKHSKLENNDYGKGNHTFGLMNTFSELKKDYYQNYDCYGDSPNTENTSRKSRKRTFRDKSDDRESHRDFSTFDSLYNTICVKRPMTMDKITRNTWKISKMGITDTNVLQTKTNPSLRLYEDHDNHLISILTSNSDDKKEKETSNITNFTSRIRKAKENKNAAKAGKNTNNVSVNLPGMPKCLRDMSVF